MDPVVVQVTPPHTPFHLPRLPHMGPRGSKILMLATAVIISGSMVLFAVVSILANNRSFQKNHGIHNLDIPAQTSGSLRSNAGSAGGSLAVGTGVCTGTNCPAVTLTASTASVTVGSAVTLKWSVTNNPTSCAASDDWSGSKAANGSESSPKLTLTQQYLFTLTCKTKTGTGYSTVGVSVNPPQSTANSGRVPIVHITAKSPITQYTDDTVTWTVDNSPTSCAASGDWSGAQSPGGGSWNTGALTSVKQYKYTLTCSNGYGSSSPQSVYVTVTAAPPGLPITSLSSNPVGPVTPGTAVTLTWKITGDAASSCTASDDWSGAKTASGGSQNLGALNSIKTYTFTITCANSTGSTVDSAAIAVIPDPPVVSLSVSPGSMYVGNAATLSYSSTNGPTSCTASGDWTGAKLTSSGNHTQGTGTLNSARTYLYSLSCTNAGGTGYQNNVPLAVTLPPAPVVTLSASPISTTTGNSSTLTWSVSNNPTSCTASGDWTGTKASSGTIGTGTLSSVKTYSYTLNCSNAGGSDSATATVNVTSGGGGAVAPVVTISASPASIGTGSSSTISWSATNNPSSCTASGSWSGAKSGSGSQSTGTISTAGSYTYTLACSNSAGSDTKSATVTVIAVPVVSISVSPSSINTGSSATITWSATNSPTSCTASGSWSGSKAGSGSQSTGNISTAGSYTYTLSCSNSGGSGSSSATLTVSNPAPVYCGGLTPCHGSAYMANHASVGNCYAWNTGTSAYPWIINITSFRPNHPGGQRAGSLEETTAVCNHNINNILKGTASIPGYKDSSGSTTHSHQSSTYNNSSGSQLSSYRVGYYDAASPN